MIYESTSPLCVTDLSMSRSLALGCLSGLPGISDGTSLCAWGCVCDGECVRVNVYVSYYLFTTASSC